MISYRIGDSGESLLVTTQVLEHLTEYRQVADDTDEAGGQLFAHFVGCESRIVLATGPRDSDRRSRHTFVPDRIAERREISDLFKSGYHYIGDWHTHPELEAYPSVDDIENFKDVFRKSIHNLGGFVLIVVGILAPPEGLFVGLCDGDGLHSLDVF